MARENGFTLFLTDLSGMKQGPSPVNLLDAIDLREQLGISRSMKEGVVYPPGPMAEADVKFYEDATSTGAGPCGSSRNGWSLSPGCAGPEATGFFPGPPRRSWAASRRQVHPRPSRQQPGLPLRPDPVTTHPNKGWNRDARNDQATHDQTLG
jgi:hypothetical protein